VLRERDLFPTALPREPEAWAHPDPALSSAVRDCTEDSGLAPHRLIRAAEGSRDADHTRVVGQDALVCLLTLRL
jgi:hypothetical protein